MDYIMDPLDQIPSFSFNFMDANEFPIFSTTNLKLDPFESIYDESMLKSSTSEGVTSEKAVESSVEEHDSFSVPNFEELDLNLEVEKIINSKPIEGLLEDGLDIDDETIARLQSNKRKRKDKTQIKALKESYLVSSDWTKEDMTVLAERLGMSFSQVYKWHWDQKKKDKKIDRRTKRGRRQAKARRSRC